MLCSHPYQPSSFARFCLWAVFLALTISLWMPIAAPSQDASTGAIRGLVTDTAGARVNGASVAVVHLPTGMQRSVTSNHEGEYSFDLLPPGDYKARVEFSGSRRRRLRFSTWTSEALSSSTSSFRLPAPGKP
jgi:hypothetical protein